MDLEYPLGVAPSCPKLLFLGAAILAACSKDPRRSRRQPPAPGSARPAPTAMAPTATAPTATASTATAPPPDLPWVDAGASTDGRPLVRVRQTKVYGLKPPLKDVMFDVTLHNDRAQDRWFLLPAELLRPKWLGSVSHLQRTILHGARGSVLIGRGEFGEGRFHVLRVPPGGVVTIHQLHTWLWGDVPPEVTYEVVTASRVLMGDETLESWMGLDAGAPVDADVDDDRWQIGKDELSGHDAPSGEVEMKLTEDRRIRLTVPLSPMD
jgi:hypothetical protein